MSVDAADFLVFETYRDAGEHAFSNNLVSEADKDSYNAIFLHLWNAVANAIEGAPKSDELNPWTVNFGRNGGVQGTGLGTSGPRSSTGTPKPSRSSRRSMRSHPSTVWKSDSR